MLSATMCMTRNGHFLQPQVLAPAKHGGRANRPGVVNALDLSLELEARRTLISSVAVSLSRLQQAWRVLGNFQVILAKEAVAKGAPGLPATANTTVLRPIGKVSAWPSNVLRQPRKRGPNPIARRRNEVLACAKTTSIFRVAVSFLRVLPVQQGLRNFGYSECLIGMKLNLGFLLSGRQFVDNAY